MVSRATLSDRTARSSHGGSLREPLSSAERTELAGTDTTYPRANGRIGYVDLGSNPLDLSQLVLKDVGEGWVVTELR